MLYTIIFIQAQRLYTLILIRGTFYIDHIITQETLCMNIALVSLLTELQRVKAKSVAQLSGPAKIYVLNGHKRVGQVGRLS